MTTPETTKKLAVLTGSALAAVIGIGSLVGSGSTADDLTPKAYKALVQQGLSNVKVNFDGREAKLSNGTPEELARAEKVVEGVTGVRWAKIDTDPSGSLPTPPTFSISSIAGGVNISGVVPNAEVAARIRAAAASSFGEVTGNLKVDRDVGTADWLATVPKLIPSVADVDNLALSVDGDSLSIGGLLGTQAEIDSLARIVEPAIGSLTFDNTLKVGAMGAQGSSELDAEDATAIRAANVYFARGSSALDARGKAALDDIADVLERNTGIRLEIGGHAGPTDPTRGRALSDERVNAVKAYLVAAGIDAGRLTTKSYGSDPETDGDAFAEQYRRVDFIVKGN